MPRFANQDGGDEVWIESTPYPKKTARRASTEVDPKRVEAGLKLSLLNLLKSGDYTKGEMAKIFRISVPTLYRHIEELQKLLELADGLTERERRGLVKNGNDDDYDYEPDEDYENDEENYDEE
jgi:hypothetical protein